MRGSHRPARKRDGRDLARTCRRGGGGASLSAREAPFAFDFLQSQRPSAGSASVLPPERVRLVSRGTWKQLPTDALPTASGQRDEGHGDKRHVGRKRRGADVLAAAAGTRPSPPPGALSVFVQHRPRAGSAPNDGFSPGTHAWELPAAAPERGVQTTGFTLQPALPPVSGPRLGWSDLPGARVSGRGDSGRSRCGSSSRPASRAAALTSAGRRLDVSLYGGH